MDDEDPHKALVADLASGDLARQPQRIKPHEVVVTFLIVCVAFTLCIAAGGVCSWLSALLAHWIMVDVFHIPNVTAELYCEFYIALWGGTFAIVYKFYMGRD